jgi:hypothetical protein
MRMNPATTVITVAQTLTADRPGLGNRRHRNQHRGEAAERRETHDSDVKKAGVSPLNIDPQRHDRGNQAQVENAERDVPALADADSYQQQAHDSEVKRALPGHITLPLIIPVGLISNTATRIINETANL